MATKVVTSRLFPPGTAVNVFPADTVDVERRERRAPFPAATADGVIDTDGTVTITASAGKYVLAGVVDEVQSVKVDATAGQFKLVFQGQTTADNAFNISAANLKTALEALSNIAPGDVEVSGGPGDSGGTTPYVVKFRGVYAGADVTQMTSAAGGTPLSGGGAAVTITTTTAGSSGTAGQLLYCAFTVD